MHDLRCEHSTSDPKRCRCKCAGAKHGIQAPNTPRRILTEMRQVLDDAITGDLIGRLEKLEASA